MAKSYIRMIVLFGAALATMQMASVASAALIGGTIDTDTNLEWLDWTATTNISYDQMVPMLQPGGAFDVWRYATIPEVNTLYFSSAGINPLDNLTARAGQILVLQSLLGQTSSIGTLGGSGFADSSSRAMFGVPQGSGRTITELVVRTQDGPYSFASATVNAGTISDSFASAGTGHLLVRSVPEPELGLALALLTLGMMFTRRR